MCAKMLLEYSSEPARIALEWSFTTLGYLECA